MGAGREVVIGLEVHAQLLLRTKLFSCAPAAYGAPPNRQTDPVSLGLPGTLPVINARAVELAARLGLACGAHVRLQSRFARKHYFYPDLPKGYQISQYAEPLCTGGAVPIELPSGERREIPLERIHLEEDAGKLVHGRRGGDSGVDYNRAGVALVEIVSAPAIRSPEEAERYLRRLHQLVRYLGVCDGNLEQGSLRCDANVSLRDGPEAPLGTKTEVKNLNSFRFVRRALAAEISRQTALLDAGEPVTPATLTYDEQRRETRIMRAKEGAADYRYLPEPDLPPLELSAAWLAEITATLPELPHARRRRFVDELGLSDADAGALTAERALADYFEAVLAAVPQPIARRAGARRAASWVRSELLGALRRADVPLETCPLRPETLGALIVALERGEMSGRAAKRVFAELFATGEALAPVMARLAVTTPSGVEAARAIAALILAAHPNEAAAYRAGKRKLLGFFMGKGMRRDPNLAPEALEAALEAALDAD